MTIAPKLGQGMGHRAAIAPLAMLPDMIPVAARVRKPGQASDYWERMREILSAQSEPVSSRFMADNLGLVLESVLFQLRKHADELERHGNRGHYLWTLKR